MYGIETIVKLNEDRRQQSSSPGTPASQSIHSGCSIEELREARRNQKTGELNSELSKPATTDQKLVSAVTSDTWENEVLESSLPVVAEFYASWCGPCGFATPVIATLASEFKGKIKFVKLDVGKSKEIADQYDVQSIPTNIIFKSGKGVARRVGACSKEEFGRLIQECLGGLN